MSDSTATATDRIDATINTCAYIVARAVKQAIDHIERLAREHGVDSESVTEEATEKLYNRLNRIVEDGPLETLAEYNS